MVSPSIEGLTTVTFTEADGKTTIQVHATVLRIVPEAGGAITGMYAGWSQSLDRLESSLRGTADREVLVTRLVSAPPELVFRAWTDADQVARWFAPEGYGVPSCVVDARPGGEWLLTWLTPEGTEYPNRGVYREVVPPERIIYVEYWAERDGPPHEFEVTVTLYPMGDQTALTVRTVFDSVAMREGAQTQGFEVGWGQLLDRLDALLAPA